MNRTSIEWCDFTANPIRYRTADGRVVWPQALRVREFPQSERRAEQRR